MVCAANGKLPGQTTDTILFSYAPKDLDPVPGQNNWISKPFGRCSGYRDAQGGKLGGDCSDGYATDDIFFLETCIYSQICTNGADLFKLRVGQAFHCAFNATRYRQLEGWLLPKPDFTSNGHGEYPHCESWCNEWNCDMADCAGCGPEILNARGCNRSPPPSPPKPPPLWQGRGRG
mgnify:CR=1 FL=1